MTYLPKAKEVLIGESLTKCASLVECVGQGAWNFILNNGSTLRVNARADEHWLQLDVPTNGKEFPRHDAWQLLKLNQQGAGLSKLALPSGSLMPHMRVEIPLDDEVDLRKRLTEACGSLKKTAGRLHGEVKPAKGSEANFLTGDQKATTAVAGTALKRMCEETGWKFSERSDAKVAVDLETRNGFYQALVEEHAGGAISFKAELTRSPVCGERSKHAVGTMLLRASALIRLARATVSETEEGATASVETFFPSSPNAAEFAHALSALAVACNRFGRTADALWNEVVAEHYLAAQVG